MGIRVYVPDKRENLVQEVISDLYLLRQSVDYQSGTADSRLNMIDKIRTKLQKVLEDFTASV